MSGCEFGIKILMSNTWPGKLQMMEAVAINHKMVICTVQKPALFTMLV